MKAGVIGVIILIAGILLIFYGYNTYKGELTSQSSDISNAQNGMYMVIGGAILIVISIFILKNVTQKKIWTS